jgi:hypothetical protein
MIYDYPTIIVDDFFKYPLDIREFALQFKYFPSDNGTYSGVRTESLHITHINFFRKVCNKILKCYSVPYLNYNATMHFHLTGEEVGDNGWVHTDAAGDQPPGIASIIYLNPQNNNINNGTTLYKISNPNIGVEYVREMKSSFIAGEDKKDLRDKHNQDYLPTIKIGNMFNRMIGYDTRSPHAGASYFGTDIASLRLTLLIFFHAIQTTDNFTPIQRAEAFSDI